MNKFKITQLNSHNSLVTAKKQGEMRMAYAV